MSEESATVRQFEEYRPRLRAVALRMLGSTGEADDAVQEAWIRLSRSDAAAIENLGGWLTTVVARVALDMLRARTSRREDPAGVQPDSGTEPSEPFDPAEEAALADSVGEALIVVLDALRPAERLAFVLHDTFAVPFEEIGRILGRSPDAAKQLASRARQKVRGSEPAPAAPGRHREVVDAFLAAARGGDFGALVALLHPDVELRADAGAVRLGAPERVEGAPAVAGMFSGRALGAETVLLDGVAGIGWIVAGRPKVLWDLTVVDGRVTRIDMLAAPEQLDEIELTTLG